MVWAKTSHKIKKCRLKIPNGISMHYDAPNMKLMLDLYDHLFFNKSVKMIADFTIWEWIINYFDMYLDMVYRNLILVKLNQVQGASKSP